MPILHVGGPLYSVRTYQGGASQTKTFRGSNAFSDASNYLEVKKADPKNTELWLTHHAGGNLSILARLVRTEDGSWLDAAEDK